MSHGKRILHCDKIEKSFVVDRQGVDSLKVLKGVGLEVFEGEIISIVGASGSGKSTLLHILGGLDRPTAGNVFWKEQDIFSLNDEKLARMRSEEVGFVFQFHHLLPEFTALENVMLPCLIQAQSMTASAERATELLAQVGLRERMNHKPSELSGGEQQRVAVARALANRPSIILADEPSGNLDSSSSEQLHELLWELNRANRQTFVIVTHNETFARQSHRVLRMADGYLHDVT